jgi:hypothetical protein
MYVRVVIIPSDEKPIIDDVSSLSRPFRTRVLADTFPGAQRILLCCVLQAVLDTCHSRTLLDLPHFHCNSVYVPWQSNGKRRTMTVQNINGLSLHHISVSCSDTRLVRRQATDFTNSISQVPLSIETAMDNQPVEPRHNKSRNPVHKSVEVPRINPSCLLKRCHVGLDAHESVCYCYPSPDALLRMLVSFAMAGASTMKLHIQTWYVPCVASGQAVTSCFMTALSFRLFGLAERMGRPKWLTDHSPVQLP